MSRLEIALFYCDFWLASYYRTRRRVAWNNYLRYHDVAVAIKQELAQC